MAEHGSKGIHSGSVTLHASSRDEHRFTVETSLQQVFDVYVPEALSQHAATERFVAQLDPRWPLRKAIDLGEFDSTEHPSVHVPGFLLSE